MSARMVEAPPPPPAEVWIAVDEDGQFHAGESRADAIAVAELDAALDCACGVRKQATACAYRYVLAPEATS